MINPFLPSLKNRFSSWMAGSPGAVLGLGGLTMSFFGLALSKFRPADFALTSLYLRYQEVGFVKRGLLGTIASTFIPNQISALSGRKAVIALGMAAIALTCFALASIYKGSSRILVIFCLISPAMYMQMGYLFGFLDAFCFLSLSLIVLIVNRLRPSVPAVALVFLLGLAGPFFHEIYLLAFFPLSLFLAERSSRCYSFAVLVSGVLAALIISVFGSYEGGAELLREVISSHYIDSVKVSTFELTSSLSENAFGTTAYLFFIGEFLRSLPGVVYLIFLASCFRRVANGYRKLFIDPRAVAFSPLLLSFLGGDSSRWIGMACMNLFVLGLVDILHFDVRNRLRVVGLSFFTFMGPIGVGASFPIVYWKIVQMLA